MFNHNNLSLLFIILKVIVEAVKFGRTIFKLVAAIDSYKNIIVQKNLTDLEIKRTLKQCAAS